MPGTGHPYELADAGAVRELLSSIGASTRRPEGERWFASRHLLKDVTAEDFVRPATSSDLSHLDERTAGCDPDVVLGEFGKGRDVRVADHGSLPRKLAAAGRDLHHVADWISNLPDGDGTLGKLHRIRLDDAAARAQRWTLDLSRLRKGRGATRDELVLPCGSRWISLLDEESLIDEGARMHHCVGSYSHSLGDFLFLSLRDPKDRPLLTAKLRRTGIPGTVLLEMRASANRLPPRTTAQAVRSMLDRMDVQPEAAFLHGMSDLRIEKGPEGWVLPEDLPERDEGGCRVLVGPLSIFVPGSGGDVAARIWTGEGRRGPSSERFLDVHPECGAEALANCASVANALGILRTNSRLLDLCGGEDGNRLVHWWDGPDRVDVAGVPLRRRGSDLSLYGNGDSPCATFRVTRRGTREDEADEYGCSLSQTEASPSAPSTTWESVASVMTELRIAEFDHWERASTFGLERGLDGTWIHRPSCVRRIADRLDDGSRIVWHPTPVDIRGLDASGRPLVAILLKDGVPARGTIDRSLTKTGSKALARILQAECGPGRVPVPLVVGQTPPRSPCDVWIGPSDGRWIATTSWRKAASMIPCPEDRPPGWNPLSMLPALGTHPDCDALVAAELAELFLETSFMPTEPDAGTYRWRPTASWTGGTWSRIPARSTSGARILETTRALGAMPTATRRKVVGHLALLVRNERVFDASWKSTEGTRRFALSLVGRMDAFMTRHERRTFLSLLCVPPRKPCTYRLGLGRLSFEPRTAEAVEGLRVLSSVLDRRSSRASHFRRLCMETLEGMSSRDAKTTGGMVDAMEFLCANARDVAFSHHGPKPGAAASVLSTFSDALWRDRRNNVFPAAAQSVRGLLAELQVRCADREARKRAEAASRLPDELEKTP